MQWFNANIGYGEHRMEYEYKLRTMFEAINAFADRAGAWLDAYYESTNKAAAQMDADTRALMQYPRVPFYDFDDFYLPLDDYTRLIYQPNTYDLTIKYLKKDVEEWMRKHDIPNFPLNFMNLTNQEMFEKMQKIFSKQMQEETTAAPVQFEEKTEAGTPRQATLEPYFRPLIGQFIIPELDIGERVGVIDLQKAGVIVDKFKVKWNHVIYKVRLDDGTEVARNIEDLRSLLD